MQIINPVKILLQKQLKQDIDFFLKNGGNIIYIPDNFHKNINYKSFLINDWNGNNRIFNR